MRFFKLIITCFCVYMLFFFSSKCLANTIELKSGKSIEGAILEKTDEWIKIEMRGIPTTYYFDEIKSLDGTPILDEDDKRERPSPSTAASPKMSSSAVDKMDALYTQAQQFLDDGDIEQALNYYKKSLQVIPEAAVDDPQYATTAEYTINMAIGTAYFQTNRPGEALPYLEKAAVVMPDRIGANIAAGISNLTTQNFDKAIYYLERVKRIEPTNPVSYYNIGLSYFHKGDMKRSRDSFLKASDLYNQQGDYEKVQEVNSKLKIIEQQI